TINAGSVFALVRGRNKIKNAPVPALHLHASTPRNLKIIVMRGGILITMRASRRLIFTLSANKEIW
ncbi:MAG TPA: hypothetical protein VGQ04_19355, partial [Chitinophagaceae bacterium]|nr:hypothetical protein [Chitinophagaceae bacterium]